MALPPDGKTFTADNATGAAIIPITQCEVISIVEDAGAASDSYTLATPQGSTLTIPQGGKIEIRCVRGDSFKPGISTGWTVKRLTAGTLTFQQIESGR